MIKSINYIIKADKIGCILSLPVQIYDIRVHCNTIQDKFYNLKLVNNTDDGSKNNSIFECYLVLRNHKVDELKSIKRAINRQKTITDSCRIDDHLKSLTQIMGGSLVYLWYTVQNRQHSSEANNSLLKLDRSTLGKYRYTSLELAMRSPMLIAASGANFRTDNPVKVESRDHN